MKKKLLLFFFVFTFLKFNTLKAQYTITAESLKKHVYVLASDSLEGREAGHTGGRKAINYIISEFKAAGLKFYNSVETNCFYITEGKEVTDNNYLIIGNFYPVIEKDYTPLVHSYNDTLSAKVVFVGYGTQNDYNNVNVKGKWVLVFRGKPTIKPSPQNTNSLNFKIENAIRNGAAGILFVSPYSVDSIDSIENTAIDANIHSEDEKILLLKIKRSTADSLFKYNNLTLRELEEKCERENVSISFELNTSAKASVSLTEHKIEAGNVVGFLEGSHSKLKNEIIVVAAHHDHLGIDSISANSTVIFHGADDNASGTACVIELAKVFSSLTTKPKRSILFVTFDAEEKGIVGSEEFVKNLPYGLKINQIKAMINFDMVGKLKENGLEIIGSNSSTGGVDLLDKYAKKVSLTISAPKESPFFYLSDQINFYDSKIPVFLLSTGIHPDYHKPTDTADKIDYEGMKKIINFTYLLINDLANRTKILQFKNPF